MAENEMKKEELGLSLFDLFRLLWKRLWLLLIVAVIVGGATFVYNYTTYSEEYTSTAKIYVLNTEVMEGASATSTAYYFQLALTVVEDCKELVLSETVLDRVTDELDLDMSPKVLRQMIRVESEMDSRVLKVSAVTDDPELSAKIVNAVSEQGVRRVREVMNVNQMSVYEYGEVSQIPSNDVSLMTPVLFGVAAALLVYVLCLIIMILDDKVNDENDVENYLGLTVLGDIPHRSDDTRKKHGNNKYYGKYYGKYVGRPDGDR